ncbi:hypothetical protein BOO69_09725 [Sulfitobacter alexandrii]|uniref:Tip attachment protein J HDII-ins2 domain-containing protein n=2 Tax=Sulfitobacter alexandrii TaxID=1917485 RepID=A0A1J0WM67_9RHOB|nr:hypothetical protein BOO69_09725 [Sulfitobacter alexandrii]
MGRKEIEAPHGLTVAEIVALALPGFREPRKGLRVLLVTDKGAAVVDPAYWSSLRPAPHARVVIRTIPGKDALRSVLLAVVSIAAFALAPYLAPTLGITGEIGVSLLRSGLTIVGQLLVNALIPPTQPESEERRNVYNIDGWRNEARPGAPVPYLFGKHRYAPPFAASSWTEVVGDQQYVRALFCLGYGPLRISDLRIGDTPISDYEDVDVEIREGREDDLPIGLYPEQVLEENAGVQLVRPKPRDLTGEIIPGSVGVETPVTRFTASNSTEASVILAYPTGLFAIDDKGRVAPRSVSVRIRARLNGEGVWQDVVTLAITAKKQEGFLRQHRWVLPTRGRWQIEVTRMTDDSTSTQASDKVVLSGIQSIRPEYPINFDKPLALVAIRVRATYQLNGPLNAFNALIEREALIHEEGAWVTGYGRTPASAYVAALTGPMNPFPAASSAIDWDQIADWHDWCVEKGLKYDRVHDGQETLGEMLLAICAAGRASPRHDGVKWGVVIDRPQALVVDHINPRNSDQFEWSRSYFNPPDGVRVRFLDETNNYEEAEMVIPWPGHVGEIRLTETMEMPGKTDPVEIYIEARRRMYELIYRPDSFSAMQSGRARVVTRGDLVMGSFDVLDRTQLAARVKTVTGALVELDEEIAAGDAYGIRFRVFADAEDGVGTSVISKIAPTDAPTRAIRLLDRSAVPTVGEIVHLGPVSTQSLPLRVRGIEGAEDFNARVMMVAAAPEIDTLTDAEVVPEWDGRIGEIIDQTAVVPAVPVFVSVASGVVGTGDAGGFEVGLQAGSGSTALVDTFELDHRLTSSGVWTTETIPAAAGGVRLDVYEAGDEIEFRARALASTTPGAYTAVATLTIGEDDPAIPAALDGDVISVAGALGHAALIVAIPEADAPTQLQIYRVPAGNPLDRATHAIGSRLAVSAGSTLSYVDGDGTRVNLLGSADFNSADAWSLDSGWTIAGGKATFSPGSAGNLSQSVPLSAGTTYRVAFEVSGYVAGTVKPRLIGGTNVSGETVTANGLFLDRLTALSGNTEFKFLAQTTFEGSIEFVRLFAETPSCVVAGAWDYYVEPLNDENIAGPVSGPFTTTIY